MDVITSLDNEKVKKYYKLRNRKYRDEYGQFLVEGEHLILEAFRGGVIKELILEEGTLLPIPSPYVYVSKEVMKKISTLTTPPKMMALCQKKYERQNLGGRILILDQIQDPGNLGTIIRSAVAFHVDTIVLSENTVDLYNPKVVRATQGMLFKINIIKKDSTEIIDFLKNSNIPVYGTRVEYGEDAKKLSKKDKSTFALVVGNEGNGVRSIIQDMCDKNLYIELNDVVESLNVAVATSILLYELGR